MDVEVSFVNNMGYVSGYIYGMIDIIQNEAKTSMSLRPSVCIFEA